MIEAVQFVPSMDQSELIQFVGDRGILYRSAEHWTADPPGTPLFVTIKTLEGEMTASPGDWIIRGIQNEFYPCKPDIFEQTYEPVD